MKTKHLLLLAISLLAATFVNAQDELVLEGGLDNIGIVENTINGDTTATGERVNPNRIYVLKANQFYVQQAPIVVNNPDGTIVIRGEEGGSKPVIVKQQKDAVAIGTSQINSSITLKNLQYHMMESDGTMPFNLFNIKGDNRTIMVEDCLIENCNGMIFNTNNVTNGAKVKISGSYFRDFHNGTQWWSGRIVFGKVPYDTLIFENNTVSGAGLTIHGKGNLFDYSFINHNTFINQKKYPFLSVNYKELYLTNNLFINGNMTGEDTVKIATGGQDPDALLMGIIGMDTIQLGIGLQGKYMNADSTALTEDIDEISDYVAYIADNVVTSSASLDSYYNGELNTNFDAPESHLGTNGPDAVLNVPGIWMNERTEAMFSDWDNLKDENNAVYEFKTDALGLGTDPLSQDAADVFAQWNRKQYKVPGVESPSDWSSYHFGDYDPMTVPGVETESAGAGEGGIRKISDMVENFSYTKRLISLSDGLPVGALHWDDIEYRSDSSLARVINAYNGIYIDTSLVKDYVTSSGGTSIKSNGAAEFNLKNYPNPCKESTTITFTLPKDSNVELSVYDVSGKLVKSLINEHRAMGTHSINFNTTDLNGMYFYKLTSNKNTATSKMLIIK